MLDGSQPDVAVVELEPQTLWEKVHDDGRWCYRPNREVLDRVAAYPLAKLVHGVGQPLGGAVADPVGHLPLLSSTVDLLEPAWVSEHLSFNRAVLGDDVAEAGFLLPPRQDAATVRVAAHNVVRYGEALGRPVAFETGVSYLRPAAGEMSDGAFWAAIAEAADCGILLDLHNLWCNELNGRQRVLDVLDELPLDRVWEVHLAGGMPMSGYWLDAHSDRVPRALLDLAAEVVPRLPGLGALMFELLPEHLRAVGVDAVAEQVGELSALWRLRGPSSASPAVPAAPAGPVGAPTPGDLAAVRDWETSLVRAVTRPDLPAGRLADDPGIGVYRELIGDFRRGSLAQTLRYTMTSLLLGIGARRTSELLGAFFRACPADSYRAVEADHFARFLLDRPALLDEVRYLREVLGYEHALVRATVAREDSLIAWTADPTAILGALDAGRAPPALPVVPSSMRVSA